MYTLIFRGTALASALMLAGCQRAPSGTEANNAATAPIRSQVRDIREWVEGGNDPRARIYCAFAAHAPIAQDCRMEIVQQGTDRILVLSRSNGAFRRLRLGSDGAIGAADGAVEPHVAGTDRAIGIVFGIERYSVPASVRGVRVSK
jgi:hypothetical protein